MDTFHITISFLIFFTFNFWDVFAAPNRHLCLQEQRDALLEFKNEFEIRKHYVSCSFTKEISTYQKMESWKNNSDCCYWDGIKCDARTGEVIELDLSFSCLHGRFQSNTSLFRLQNLRFLDLSYNDLYGKIPSSVENLSHLTSLDFSNNQFSGEIPSPIGKLLRLTSLVFSKNNFDGEIPSSFGSLKQLTELHVDSNKLSGNFPISLLNLTNLSGLLLFQNRFTGYLPPNISSLSNLKLFDASDNTFVGTIPSSLFTIPSLTIIFLKNNQLNGTLDDGNISSPSQLQMLGLGNNHFRGPIPRFLCQLVNLMLLYLSRWNSQGPVDFSIFSYLNSLVFLSLSNLNTTTTIDFNAISSSSKLLKGLDLSGNLITLVTNKSSVSDHPLQILRDLKLSGCGITEFPKLLRTQQQMSTLDISNNKIKGQVPGWLWTLQKLYHVDLSNNSFINFERSTKHGLSADLTYLFASRNNFTGNIPSFICELPSLYTLDLSYNNFNGSIPLCLGNLKSTLSVLNLRQNRLSGGLLGNVFESLRSLDMGHNQLVGKLPRSLMNFSTLEVLNVESNLINDTFPSWLSSLQNLQVLVLRSNAFHGPIHQASFFTLKIIDISHNHFNGILPFDYFVNWSNMSSPGTNEDRSNANYMGTDYYQDSMVLMNKGIKMELVRILKIYTALDFSGNRFEGEIPKSIGLLKELHVLNLSNNAFNGHIPSSMGNLTALESIDLSQNKLSGEIPQELGNLSYLAYMNFSHNQLIGLVPGGTQFRRQPCSSFEENSGLFGPALDEDCRDIRTPSLQQFATTKAEEEEDEEVFSWIAAAIGFGPGIVFGLTIGYILVFYKPEWFTSPYGRNKHRRKSTTTH